MMKNIRLAGVISLLTLITTISCKRTLYNHPDNSPPRYYMPLQVGRYAIYKLDSINFYHYGQLDTLTQYLAKDTVENFFVGNLGDTTWVVERYLSPATGPIVWTPNETNTVNTSQRSVDLTENNLRFIKLGYPMQNGLTWSGNSYIPDNPYQDYNFTAPKNVNVNGWTYTYQNVDQPFAAGGQTYDSTVTILQVDDSSNVNINIIVDTSFASRTYWSETYAKNIGLVYRHTILWDYQPPPPQSTQSGYKLGFKVTLTLLEHN
ncbi:MAG: hypothetical protein J0H74_26245 [Chitinophagaceae bacterium]|nr:hypothetical protein [Chitinophagaceae bacterium]